MSYRDQSRIESFRQHRYVEPMNSANFARLIESTPENMPGMFNPYKEHCPHDTRHNSLLERMKRLSRHLNCDAKLILIGEAIGYQGGRVSGLAFTSERLLMDGAIPRIERVQERLSNRHLPFSEPSATIVWKTLYKLGMAEQTVLWNSVQLHPFKLGNLWSNRTPTNAEVDLGVPALRVLFEAYPNARVVPVGQKAADSLARNFAGSGVSILPAVRHPANGGAKLFADGLEEIVKGLR